MTSGRAVQMNNSCSGVTIDSCTFKGGYYVTIQGRANDLTVKNSEIENCKSGINLQSGSNLVVENTNISVVALGEGNDTYCVRFASSAAGSGTDMNITPAACSMWIKTNKMQIQAPITALSLSGLEQQEPCRLMMLQSTAKL